ncbi:hypothetical protein A9P82_02450 [Arachidicoccus ginsenosidimutans]|nr:hypothetical protein A9P82_02450 [Arachidicoccus sp. BS20]
MDTVAKDAGGLQTSYIENGNAITLNGTVYHFTPDFIGVPISLEKGAGSADTVFATVEPALVESYNQLYQENNAAIPDGAFGASNNGAFAISSGATTPVDSLYATLLDGSQLKDSAMYLVPIKLKDKNGTALKSSIVFFKMRIHKINLGVLIDTIDAVQGVTPIPYKGGYFFDYFGADIADEYDFNIQLNAKFPQKDLKVSVEAYNDTASVNAFNAYDVPFPDGSFSISQKDYTIPAGALTASDNIQLKITNKSLFQSFTTYLLVVKLKQSSDTDNSVPVLGNGGIFYISFFTF